MVHERYIFSASLEIQHGHVTSFWDVTTSSGQRIGLTLKRIALLNYFFLIKMFWNTEKSWKIDTVNIPILTSIFIIANIVLYLFYDINYLSIHISICLFHFYPFQSCRHEYTSPINSSCFSFPTIPWGSYHFCLQMSKQSARTPSNLLKLLS